MNRLFPLPIYTFIKTAYQSGGISVKGLRNLPSWLLKLILLEPLRWVELTYNRKIERHIIQKDPVFILGFYRSGTSYLHDFLRQDDRFGYHTNFQMIFPDMMLAGERWLTPFFDLVCRTFNLQDPVHRIQMSFRFPGEEDGAMTTSVNPRGSAWGNFFPKIMMSHFPRYGYLENIPESEVEGWKQDYLFLIKKISLAGGGKQLVLKSPPNTARIRHLLSLFPKATFIFIHRDPFEVYASNKKLWKVFNKLYVMGSIKSVDVNGIILDTFAGIMQRYLEQKDLIPEGQLYEVGYRDFIREPLEQIRSMYATLHLGDFGYCEEAMKRYAERQKSYIRLAHDLPAEEEAAVVQKLGPYIRQWGYSLS